MTDRFAAWKLMQDQMIAAQKAQLDAATKVIGMGTNYVGAMEAAQKVAVANMRAWQSWMALWGVRK